MRKEVVKEVLKWIKEHIIPVAVAVVVIGGFIILASVENPASVSIEQVAPFVGSIGIDEVDNLNDITYNVTAGVDLSTSFSNQLMSSVTGMMGGKVETASTIKDLVDAAVAAQEMKGTTEFTIPAGAVVAASYEDVGIYYWTKVSKNIIPLTEHREGHIVLKCNGYIIDVRVSTVGLTLGTKVYSIL